jgi:alpha-tubulin suppressor-like RCC1 family protein
MDFNVHVPFDVRSAISCGYNHVAVVTLEGKVAGFGVGTAITNALCPQN